MNKFSKITGLLAVTTAAVGTVLLLSTPANARSTLSEVCHGSSRLEVESCCASWVEENGRPFFWFASSKSCGAPVVCVSSAQKKKTLTSAIVIPPKKVKEIDCQIEASADPFQGGGHSPSNPPTPPPTPTPAPTPPPADPEVPR